MDVLSPEYEEFIQAQIDAGEFASRQEAIEAAIDNWMMQKTLATPTIREELLRRLQRVENGETIQYDEISFNQYRQEILDRIEARQPTK